MTLTLTEAERDVLVDVLEQARDDADRRNNRVRRATCIELLFRLGVMTLMDEDEDDRP